MCRTPRLLISSSGYLRISFISGSGFHVCLKYHFSSHTSENTSLPAQSRLRRIANKGHSCPFRGEWPEGLPGWGHACSSGMAEAVGEGFGGGKGSCLWVLSPSPPLLYFDGAGSPRTASGARTPLEWMVNIPRRRRLSKQGQMFQASTPPSPPTTNPNHDPSSCRIFVLAL